ncbi:MAG: hypothetical protein DHS20C01_18380 [marine bacterium B5-7]|nr:MAG: hypothetical protein DHS20C01_18380 [marine bacterium B5-7]
MAIGKILTTLILLGVVAAIGWQVNQRLIEVNRESPERVRGISVIPVEVQPVTRGVIERRRAFTGTLNSPAEFVVAPKLSGRILEITVDLADPVNRGQVVARLDNDEYVQALAQAEADLAVSRANFNEAKSLLAIADRDLERAETLRGRGVSSDAERDAAKANQLAKAAHVEVTRAQMSRAVATVETARIQLGYSDVIAAWQGGQDTRVVAERFVDEGDTVSANAPLLRIVELDPINAVVFVTEADYGLLRPGQRVDLKTDAFKDSVFKGEISRISPVFIEDTRQARVEITLDNKDLKLKPGMFARVSIMLERFEDAVILPATSLVVRDGSSGVFVVDDDGATVHWQSVETGVRDGDRVQAIGSDVEGRVVTLGQQLLDDGSKISISELSR